MQELNLFLNIMEITHELIEDGVTIDNAHHALMRMDVVFDAFEENEGDVSDVQLAFQEVFFTVKHMPEEFKRYFQTIESFHKENEIYLCDLPARFKANTIHEVQFISGLFTILNTLLSVGINSCNNHQSRTEIFKLFAEFEKDEDTINAECSRCSSEILEEENEDVNNAKCIKNILDHIAIKEKNMHPTLKEYYQMIESLPKTPKSEDINDEDLQTILVVSDKSDKSVKKQQSINFDHFFADLNDICDWSTFNI